MKPGGLRVLGPALALVLVMTACTSSEAPEPELRMTLAQQRFDEGTDRAALRVTNASKAAVEVSEIGLDWAGYGRFLVPYPQRIEPGDTVGHAFELPTVICDVEADARPVGIARVGDAVVRSQLDTSGEGFVRRLWQEGCAVQRLDDAASYGYGPPWRMRGRGETAELLTSLHVVRRTGDEPIHLVQTLGSVLFELSAPGSRTLAAGRPSGALPLRITPGRCDEHARSQASQPFLFRLQLRIGADPQRLSLLLEPTKAQQAELLDLLDRACG